MPRRDDLRSILQYIPHFREKIFVLAIDGAIVTDENFRALLLDLALLWSLNIRVVLVHGAAEQIVALAAEQVAGTFVGAEFRASVTFLLPVLAVARLFGVVNQFYFQISFQLSERPFLSVAQSCFTLILGIALMFPLVAGYGLFGAALATLMTETVGLLVAIYLTRHAFRLPFDISRLSGVAAAVIIMGVAILITKSVVHGTGWYSLLTVSIVGGVAYTGAGWLFNVAKIRTLSIKSLRARTLTKNALGEQRRITS